MTNDRQAVPNGSVLAVSSREIPPSRFNARTGAWSMGAARTTEGVVPPTPYKLRLVSWNIWFGTHRWRERLDALLAIVDRWSPDLIGLQEVTPRQLAQILETDWIRSSFVCSDTDGSTLEPHGVLLLSRIVGSVMGRVGGGWRRERVSAAEALDELGDLAVVALRPQSAE